MLTDAAQGLTELDIRGVYPGDDEFYDVQVTRERQIARICVDGILMGPIDEAVNNPAQHWRAAVEAHLIFYEVGIVVIRLTISSNRCDDATPSLDEVRQMSNAIFGPVKYRWTIRGADDLISVDSDVRGMMDVLFFELHENSSRRQSSLARHVEIVNQGWEARYKHLEDLVKNGEILSAYPVVFGSHIELDPSQAGDQTTLAGHLASEHFDEKHTSLDGMPPIDLNRSEAWYMRENTSIVFFDESHEWNQTLGTFTPVHTQLMEYLTLQRGGLRAVQRATQLTITENHPVTRRKVADWSRVVAAVTDDYVLHDQIARTLEPVQRHFRDERELRDPAELQVQVESNIASFQSALDARTDRAGVVLSLLFGIVAATALVPLANQLIIAAFGLRTPVDSFQDVYRWTAIVIDLALVVIVGIISYLVYLRVTRGGLRRVR